MALSTSSGSGTQTNTQSPQASTGTTGTTEASSSVQPGTATSLLSDQSGGVPLLPTPLTTVNLSASSQTQTQSTAAPSKHHVNGALLGISATLFVIAVALFWFTSKSVKKTTN